MPELPKRFVVDANDEDYIYVEESDGRIYALDSGGYLRKDGLPIGDGLTTYNRVDTDTDPRPHSDPSSAEDIDNRFNYHPPTPAKVAAHESTRAAARDLAHLFDGTLPPGREKSLALTQLELALFWANAAIARHS